MNFQKSLTDLLYLILLVKIWIKYFAVENNSFSQSLEYVHFKWLSSSVLTKFLTPIS